MDYILRSDRALLDLKIKKLDEQISALSEEFKEAVSQSSETWHDNAPFDAARDKQNVLASERNNLVQIRLTTKLYNPKSTKHKVQIGSKVTLDGHRQLRVLVAGVWSGVKMLDGCVVVTSNSPIGLAILGCKAGDQVDLPVGKYIVSHVE